MRRSQQYGGDDPHSESLAIRYHTIRTNQIKHTRDAFLSAAEPSIQRDPQLLQRYRLERVQVDAP